MLSDGFEEKKGKNKEKGKHYGTYLMVPTTEENLTFFSNVERKTKELLRKRFKINVTSDWEIYTIAVVTLNSACSLLGTKMRTNFWNPDYVEFYDMLTIASSNRKNEKAEKIGNINCLFIPGKAIEIIETDPENFWNKPQMRAADVFLPENKENLPWNVVEMAAIAKNASGVLSYNHDIIIPDKDIALILATTYVFLEQCYKHLIIATINREDKLLTRVTYELGTLIRLNGRESSDQIITIELTPGPGAKKTIKNDANEGEVRSSDDED